MIEFNAGVHKRLRAIRIEYIIFKSFLDLIPGPSPCSKVRDVTRWGVGPGFSISHYITVSDPSGGAGGRGLLILSDLSTRRASGDPAEMPDRGFCPSRRNVT